MKKNFLIKKGILFWGISQFKSTLYFDKCLCFKFKKQITFLLTTIKKYIIYYTCRLVWLYHIIIRMNFLLCWLFKKIWRKKNLYKNIISFKLLVGLKYLRNLYFLVIAWTSKVKIKENIFSLINRVRLFLWSIIYLEFN